MDDKTQSIISVIGLDMWGGDYANRRVKNYNEAIEAAKEWVTDYNKCATYFYGESTIYFKYSRQTNPTRSSENQHSKCTSFFFGTIIKKSQDPKTADSSYII
jgi:hypothetical protein